MPEYFIEGNAQRSSDTKWKLLQKWCSVLYDRLGDHGPVYYPEGSRPLPWDTAQRLYTKIEALRNGGAAPTPAPAITPLTYPDLLAWWDASQLAYADGTIIDGTTHKFVDQTGNGYDGIPGGGGPILKTSIINGKNVVRFNGSADYLTYSPLSIPGMTGGVDSDYTIIFIGTASNDGIILGLSSSNYQAARINWSSTNTISNFLGSSDIVSLPFANSASSVRMSSWRRTGILIKHRENKTDRTGVTPSNPPTDGSAWTANSMGHYWAALFLAGDVGEVLVYNAYLQDFQMDALYTDYFKPKWGLP